MKKGILLLVVVLAMLAVISCSTTGKQPADWVDPFIGTGFHGHTYPGATTPHGMVQLSPDTRRGNWDACGGYHYSDSTMYGFSHTHLSGTGCLDYGDILFHPTLAEPRLQPQGYIFDMLPFSHKDETAAPGYYRVRFPESGITAELTATPHTGIHRYTFPAADPARIIIDLHHGLENERIDHLELSVLGDAEIAGARLTSGWTPNQHLYFVARFSRPFTAARLVSAGELLAGSTHAEGQNLQAILEFKTAAGEAIDVHVGLSLVSIDNARMNLDAEAPAFGFAAHRSAATRIWNEALAALQVEGGRPADKKVFYTSLYHALVVPNLTSDVNGDYRGNDLKVKRLPAGEKSYSTLSLWDTYRAWHPLMTMIDRELTVNIVKSMLAMYDATGELPIWPLACGETYCMIGYHSASVIWDAWQKGIRDFDGEKAFAAMVASSNKLYKGGDYYLTQGWIPANYARESVSCLLEYGYDDWCVAMMARELGKPQEQEIYTRRARKYTNVFDGGTGFFRGKRSDGNWVTPFNPVAVSRDFTEATPWQYRFNVQHDINGFMQLLGGRDQFAAALDSLFHNQSGLVGEQSDISGLIGQYAHGNEPSHHVAYLYNYAGQPWKTQAWVRHIQKNFYTATPEGLIGNEDCGQMSAWYLLSALGLYQVCPGSGEYALSAPLFPKTTVRLNNGKSLIITANNPEQNSYIHKVTLNGREISANYVTHAMIMEGGELAFTLGSQPETSRGTAESAMPYSLSQGRIVSVPFVLKDLALFLGQVECALGCRTEGAAIHYTLDGSEPGQESPLYTGPFTLSATTTIRARAFKEGYEPSPEFSIQATRAELREPDKRSASLPGVAYKYYEGRFQRTAEMVATPALKSGTMPEPAIDGARAEDHFGFEFTGYIHVPEDGFYDFYTESDDGSALFIGGELVVDNDGSHSAVRSSGKAILKQGFHKFRLLYFDDYEGDALEWGWTRPGAAEPVRIGRQDLYIK